MEDEKQKALNRIGKMWLLSDHIESFFVVNNLIDDNLLNSLYGEIYSRVSDLAEKSGITDEELQALEKSQQNAAMSQDDRVQLEVEERVAMGEDLSNISFG